MNYQIFSPAEELREYVKCFWTLDGEYPGECAKQRVMPDGCMEMIFHYGDLYLQYSPDNTSFLQPKSFVYGQITKYLEIAPTGTTGIISARFHPDGLLPILPVPVKQLEDRAVDLEELFGSEGVLLSSQVVNAPGTAARIALIEQFLVSQLQSTALRDSVTRSCIDLIIRSQGVMTVDEISDAAKINRRNLERRFDTAIGLSPKQLSKVVRLQTALRLLEKKEYSTLTALAYESGYYDQAHFIKDFREFTGSSPGKFYSHHLRLAALFTNPE